MYFVLIYFLYFVPIILRSDQTLARSTGNCIRNWKCLFDEDSNQNSKKYKHLYSIQLTLILSHMFHMFHMSRMCRRKLVVVNLFVNSVVSQTPSEYVQTNQRKHTTANDDFM